jgi:DNA ligase D-like protein (predicted 3'-phosphoesterase)
MNDPEEEAVSEEKELLKRYREKRDFKQTSEPSGGKAESAGQRPIFVIQKHQASTLHFDFRLEADGVLKSWAVPKGPSTDPSVKRLAIPTEDHPLEYAGFEGNIPDGQYGAGTVEVWDTGTYRNTKFDGDQEIPPGKSIEDGHITFQLEGKKLKGGYALTRTGRGKEARWLLVKMNDTEANIEYDPVKEQPDSVLTGRSLEEIREGK